MCTECLTELVRPLARLEEADWYWTLRIGDALFTDSPVIVCGPQEEIAGFRFSFADEDGMPVRAAEPGDDPARIQARLFVLDAADWARFLCVYALEQGLNLLDLGSIVTALETEAAALFARAVKARDRSLRELRGELGA